MYKKSQSQNLPSQAILKTPVSLDPWILENIYNRFTLPQYIIPELSSYHLIYWSGNYLRSQNRHGHLEKDGKIWKIIFHHCTCTAAYKSSQVKISFRSYGPGNAHNIAMVIPADWTMQEISKREYLAATKGY